MRVWLCRVLRKGNTIVRTTKLNSDIAEELKAFCKANVHERPA